MTEKQIRQLNRRDLLEMMIGQAEIIEKQKKQIEEMQIQLDDRVVKIERAGSLAEAVLDLNGVMTAAQAAAEQYTHSIQVNEAQSRKTLEEAMGAAERIVAEANEKAERVLAEAREKAAKLLDDAKAEGARLTAPHIADEPQPSTRKGLFSRG